MRFQPNVRRIAAIHDLSGIGRTSLMAVIPILSTMGFNVCPLPTAILSNHSQYPDFSFLDLRIQRIHGRKRRIVRLPAGRQCIVLFLCLIERVDLLIQRIDIGVQFLC